MAERRMGTSGGFLLCLLVVLSGCNTPMDSSGGKARADRVEKIALPMGKGQTLDVQTDNGSILVIGANVQECKITAAITVQAASERQIKELADKVKIKARPSRDGVVIRAEKPMTFSGQVVSVSYEVTVPRDAGLSASSQNGTISANNLTGPVKADTQNGSITLRDCLGKLTLQTGNGGINANEIMGDTDLSSKNGMVVANYAGNAPANCSIHISTHNGGIELTPPKKLSATADMVAHNGSIRCSWPMSLSALDKHMRGVMGKGDGRVVLETANGSIWVREP